MVQLLFSLFKNFGKILEIMLMLVDILNINLLLFWNNNKCSFCMSNFKNRNLDYFLNESIYSDVLECMINFININVYIPQRV